MLESIKRCFTIGILAVLPLTAYAQQHWQVARTIPVGGEGSWDYLTVDPQTHRLFVPRSTHTMVIDPATGKVLGDIPGQKIAHGVALVPAVNRGFISDGGGAIVVFDLKTYKTLGTLPAEKDADGIIFDPVSGLVLVVSGDGGTLMTFKPGIDPVHGRLDASIPLGGAPEFLAADASGKVYINLEDKNTVAVVDLKTRKVLAHWPVAPGGSPVGMVLDEKAHHLAIGCREPQKLVVMDTHDGKVTATLSIGPSVDATKLEGGEMFASSDGVLTVAREAAPGKFEVVQSLKTAAGARTMGVDPSTHTIYLPSADFEPLKPGQKRPSPKSGTFRLLVVTPAP